ncbi:hypothetical protein [Mesorhizobium sp. B2-3-10]|uniref:hypothetical protein n=1 Tax=Mesorhizobium sp. B2-3-10 TaxID=2589954 RepID=UPI00112D3C78|nr:hypothetical protein [Mesorhizobium sp. B2-3-10]TPL97314.1 hypothetical protein FJ943_18210 [Mesorhizobium sp. B2-3-10]
MESQIAGATPDGGRIAANDNRPTRKEILYATDAFLKANPEPHPPAVRIRYRGTRPAMNWLAKHDAIGAASLWRIARQRRQEVANDNRSDAEGLGIDRRKDGKPRGRNPDPRSLDAYLAIPAVQPRLGDREPEPTYAGLWDGGSRGITIKCQDWIHPDAAFTDATRFSFHPAEIATGAIFLGSVGGLGQPKMGKRRGDTRRLDEPKTPAPSEEIDTVIETILSGGNVADVGKALGAKGGGADRKGGKSLRAAGAWASAAIVGSELLRHSRIKAA